MFARPKKQPTEQEALLKLSAMCAQAEHSSGEVRERMRRWGLPPDAVERVLDRLVGERFVDDGRFARLFVRDKVRFDRWGRRKIEQALYKKGVGGDTARDALDAVPEADYIAALAPLIAAKRRTVKAATEYELNAKLVRFALGRGFDMGVIRRCMGDADISDDCMPEDENF